MKFALRDDDLNYFFNPEDISRWYDNIWNVCPISMSVIPFVQGNWKKNTSLLEKLGSNNINEKILNTIKADDVIYKIGDNTELVSFVQDKISKNKIHLTMHGVNHRNRDSILPKFDNNFSIGAEFFTDRDLTKQVKEGKKYIEKIFGQNISVFTPPQNLLSFKGIKALVNNDLSICGDLPSMRQIQTIKLIGIKNFLSYVSFRVKNKTDIYPYPIKRNKFKFITHFRLQPGTNLNLLYQRFDEIYNYNGNFVLSTHSYGFDERMRYSGNTMQFELEKFINYTKNKGDVEFVSLKDVF